MHARFFFSDWCSGQTWSLRHAGGAAVDFVEHTGELLRANGSVLSWIRSLGEDADGEIYLTSHRYNGDMYRVVPSGLRLHMPRLTAGGLASIRVTSGSPNAMTGLFFGLGGLGSTLVQQAQVSLGIKNAHLVGISTTDAVGAVTFAGNLPIRFVQDRTVWMQVAQLGVTSNIGVATVE
jgi:hypothetical protein